MKINRKRTCCVVGRVNSVNDNNNEKQRGPNETPGGLTNTFGQHDVTEKKHATNAEYFACKRTKLDVHKLSRRSRVCRSLSAGRRFIYFVFSLSLGYTHTHTHKPSRTFVRDHRRKFDPFKIDEIRSNPGLCSNTDRRKFLFRSRSVSLAKRTPRQPHTETVAQNLLTDSSSLVSVH